MEKDKILYKSFLEGDKNALQELVMNYKNNLIYFISYSLPILRKQL